MGNILSMLQVDMPLGRAFWVALLTVVVIVAFSGQPLWLPDLEPGEFILEAFLIFGYFVFLTLVICAPLVYFIHLSVYSKLGRYLDEGLMQKFFLVKTGRRKPEALLSAVFPIAVGIAVFCYRSTLVHRVGPVGILLFLLIYLFYPRAVVGQTLILRWKREGNLYILLLSGGQTDIFSLDMDRRRVIEWLTSSGWEVRDATIAETEWQIVFGRDKPVAIGPAYQPHFTE